ncbi:type II toxin-antitoxin system RelE/ParE family toxin [Lactococcus insecticola]|uniref:type II toxin-antitoxin system RelE/ParE family toxin n=1 Tax=Pseudolactococcus insecticola TaxID=2709158 RepID=UPI001E383BC3|nr:type II toxin-antitoxin system RelE/ParE family toxin [Lactococcus insecticola]
MILTQNAIADIDSIEDFISTHYSVPNSISKFRRDLENVLEEIAEFPESGVSYREIEGDVVRKWVRNRYIYLYVEYSVSIRILQISYEKTDWQNRK